MTAVVNMLKRRMLPGPVVYSAVPSAVKGTISPLDALTKNKQNAENDKADNNDGKQR